jgi:hypothetical protein
MHRLRLIALPLLALVLAAPRPARAEPAWERVAHEDGITVTKRDVPGRGFPTFRGVGVVAAPVWDVLAVLSDVPRYPEWQVDCIASRLLRKTRTGEMMCVPPRQPEDHRPPLPRPITVDYVTWGTLRPSPPWAWRVQNRGRPGCGRRRRSGGRQSM